jgi:hypothetical protein
MVSDKNTDGCKDLVLQKRTLTPAQFGDLADVPPELEWLANLTNLQNAPFLQNRRRGNWVCWGARNRNHT